MTQFIMKYNDGSDRAKDMEKRFHDSMNMLLENDEYIFTPEAPNYTVDYLSEQSIANRSGMVYEEERKGKKPVQRIREKNGADILTLKAAINIFSTSHAGTMDNYFYESMHKEQVMRKIHKKAKGNFRTLINLLKGLLKSYYSNYVSGNWNVIRYGHNLDSNMEGVG